MFDALPPPSFWYGLRGKTRTNLILFVGVYPCVRPQCSPHVGVITGAHGGTPLQINRARRIAFPPSSCSGKRRSRAGGGQEGIVRHTLRFLRINPPQLPFIKGRNVLKAKPSRERLGTFPPPSRGRPGGDCLENGAIRHGFHRLSRIINYSFNY